VVVYRKQTMLMSLTNMLRWSIKRKNTAHKTKKECLEYMLWNNEHHTIVGPSWSWEYGSWIYNYQCNQWLSLLTLWVQIPLRRGVLDTTLCGKVCQWLATGRWFSPGTPVSFTNKTDRHHTTGILLKVALNTIHP
jgi:hypothetical protein